MNIIHPYISFVRYMTTPEQVATTTYQPVDPALFPDFQMAIEPEYPNIKWEAHQVTTETGYVKTMFRLVGDEQQKEYKPSKGPVLIVNGAGTTTMRWFDVYDFLKVQEKTKYELLENLKSELQEMIETEA